VIALHGDGMDACNDGIRLTTNTDSSCYVMCEAGYTGLPARVTCSPDATDGAAATSVISCKGNAQLLVTRAHE
jgi:hypothetical protein